LPFKKNKVDPSLLEQNRVAKGNILHPACSTP
jgi:hypothetical protein